MPGGGRGETERRFEAIVAARRPALVRAAARILEDAAEAEDVVQESLARTWQRLDAIAPGALKAYLFRAVELNALKRRARRRRGLPLDKAPEPAAADAPEGPEDRLDPLELERALGDLGPSQQAVIRMKYYAGMTFREIGASLSISSNTAASRCRYALDALRRALGAKGK